MRRECRERFPRHRRLAIPTCITARESHTCRDACRDRLTSGFLWNRWWGKRSRHSRRMRNPQSHVSGKWPIGHKKDDRILRAFTWKRNGSIWPNFYPFSDSLPNLLESEWRHVLCWKQRVFLMPALSKLVVPGVAIKTTSSATSETIKLASWKLFSLSARAHTVEQVTMGQSSLLFRQDTYKTRGVVVANSFSITEGFENGVTLNDLVLQIALGVYTA